MVTASCFVLNMLRLLVSGERCRLMKVSLVEVVCFRSQYLCGQIWEGNSQNYAKSGSGKANQPGY